MDKNEIENKLHVLSQLAMRLNRAGIVWCAGASVLLYFNGLASEFHDLDLQVTERDAARMIEILDTLGHRLPTKADTTFRTKQFLEYVVDGVEIDVIAGFAIAADGYIYDCALEPVQIISAARVEGQIIPLQALGRWKTYYRLMGRPDKAAILADYPEVPLNRIPDQYLPADN